MVALHSLPTTLQPPVGCAGSPLQVLFSTPVRKKYVCQILFYECNFIVRLTFHGAVDRQVAECKAVERGIGHVVPGVDAVVDALLWIGGVGTIDPDVVVCSYSLSTTALHRN